MTRTCSAWFVLIVLVAVPLAAQEGKGTRMPATTQTAPSPINLNTATVAQLESLPGIGKSTAERIIEYRQKSGGFRKIEDLMNVQGIGEKNFLKLKPLVTVSAPRNERASQP